MGSILGIMFGVGACVFIYRFLKSDFDDSVYRGPMIEQTNTSREVVQSTPKKSTTVAKPKSNSRRNAKPSKPKTTAKRAVAKKSKATKKNAVAPKKSTTKNRSVKSDDLTRINGIGPKIAVFLDDNGFKTFQHLAKFDSSKLSLLVQKSGIRVRQDDPSMWIEQAKLAQKNDWEGLKKLQQKQKSKRIGNVKQAA